MLRRPLTLVRASFLGVALTVVGASPAAWAAGVKGQVILPDETSPIGYWRVDNGVVPVTPAGAGETVVFLAGVKGAPPAAKTVAVELSGLEARPAVVVVSPGSTVEIKNSDRVAHALASEDGTTLRAQKVAPGQAIKQRFAAAGQFIVRSEDYPHMLLSVLVIEHPHFAQTDERGAFSIASAPEGSATLKVWSRGRVVHEEKVDIGSKPLEVNLKVAPAPSTAPGSRSAASDAPAP